MSELSTSLRSLLGAESAGEWVNFMDKIGVELPFLLTRGRPTADAITDSEIGRSGHKSWTSYVENELAWNISTWRAWQRAYSAIVKFPYLRDLGLSASAINALNAKSESFPSDLDAYNAVRAGIASNANKARTYSLVALKDRIGILESDISEALSETHSAKEKISALQARLSSFNALSWFARVFARP